VTLTSNFGGTQIYFCGTQVKGIAKLKLAIKTVVAGVNRVLSKIQLRTFQVKLAALV
jgi:hypothetical protein